MTDALGRLVVAEDGDEFVLGRPDLGTYVVVPRAGAVLVQALQAGAPLATATAMASEAAGADVDGEDFLASLAEAGLLDPPVEPDGQRRARQLRWIEVVSPGVARRLFGPTAWTGYATAATFVLVVLLARPDLRPSYEHAWWQPDPVLSVLAVFSIGLSLAALHEAWHWLAGRAVGVPAAFRVSYRGIFLVFETDLTQLVAVPRRKRYGAYLAGMAVDVTVLAAALALRLAHRTDVIALAGWLDRLLAAIVLVQVLGICWQWAALFLRSDGYAVLANALRCHNLYRATWLITKDRLWRLTGADAAELDAIGAHDRRVARWFGLVYLAGMVLLTWVLVTFLVPFVTSMLWWVAHNLTHPAVTAVAFWESVAVALVVIGQYALVPALALRERRLRRSGALR